MRKTCVTVAKNSKGSVYEITDKPGVYTIYLQQITLHLDGDHIVRETRVVPHQTTCKTNKAGDKFPGEILRAFTTNDIGEQNLYKDWEGGVYRTSNDEPVYSYLYWTCDPLAVDEDINYLLYPKTVPSASCD